MKIRIQSRIEQYQIDIVNAELDASIKKWSTTNPFGNGVMLVNLTDGCYLMTKVLYNQQQAKLLRELDEALRTRS